MRPISNVVDITNYVMLALGNPLHAFDRASLAGDLIVVRRAMRGEKLRTLDGVERELDEQDLVIADAERAIALAGIMGGEETEVRDSSNAILLEAANFEPFGLLRSSERLKLRTEGSNRWEKGVDPYLAAAGGVVRHAAPDRARGRPLAGRQRRPRRAAGPTSRPAQAGSCRRADRARDEPRRATLDPERLRLRRRRRLERDGSDLAKPGRHPGGRPDRGDRTGPDGRGPVHAALAPRDVRLAHAACSACGGGSRTCSQGLACPRSTRRHSCRRPPSRRDWRCPTRWATRRFCGGRSCTASSTPQRETSRVGNERIALFEIARVYLPDGDELPEEQLHVGGIIEGGFASGEGRGRVALSNAQGRAPHRA